MSIMYHKLFVAQFLVCGISFIAAFTPVTFDTCSKTKGCIQPYSSCTADTCQYGATWRTVQSDNKDYLEIELVGSVKANTGFVALGFSDDSQMGDDGVVGCFHDPGSSRIEFRAGYNSASPRQNQFIVQSELDPDFLIPSPDRSVQGKAEDDLGGSYNAVQKRLQCRFRRLLKPNRNAKLLKDLSSKAAFFILVARGETVSPSGFQKHFAGGVAVSSRTVSPSTDFPSSLASSGPVDSPTAKAHGCLMVLAWVLCASVGIIMARYYKDMWPNSGLIGERIWFQTHRILQSICVIFTIIGFIVIFVYVQGYSTVSAWPLYVHPILGIIVTILTIINPLLALCRCRPDSSNRPWFNWIHFFVGTIAYVLSVPTMMLGFRMSGAGLQLTQIDYPLWILIFFVLFQFCTEIILEIHGCVYYRKNKDKRHNYEMELEEYEMRSKVGPQARPREPEPSGRMFKYFMIGLHATVSAIVAFVLVIIIAVN